MGEVAQDDPPFGFINAQSPPGPAATAQSPAGVTLTSGTNPAGRRHLKH